MKDVGNTNNGNYLVEMTRDEHRAFTWLRSAVSGESQSIEFINDPSRMLEYDFTNTFNVIIAYYITVFRVNELQAHLDDIKNALKRTEHK